MVDGLQQDNISPLSEIEHVLDNVTCASFNTAAAFLTMLFQDTKMRYVYASFLLHAQPITILCTYCHSTSGTDFVLALAMRDEAATA
jgi:hypothetical protein